MEIRIGIVLSNTPGYSETFFTSKIKGLQTNGHKVTVFAQQNKENFNLCPVKLAPKVSRFFLVAIIQMFWVCLTLLPFLRKIIKFSKLERKEGSSWGTIFKNMYLNSHILKSNLDWVHFGFATQALGSEMIAKSIKAKMGISFRGFDINVYPLKNINCYTRVWKHVDKVHSISNYLLQKAHTLGLPNNTPFQIITPAVNLKKLPSTEKKSPQIVFTTIARLHWIKGLDIAISAMKKLKDRGIPFTCRIIGEGDKTHTEQYRYQVYEMKLEEEVVFLGKLNHKKTLEQLQETSIYIQPSLNEGFCNAVLEAQAIGKLCIASGAGGLPENIDRNVSGWLFEKGNVDSLVETIIKVLNLTDKEKQQFSDRAKKRVEDNFSIEKQQKEFVEFYSKST